MRALLAVCVLAGCTVEGVFAPPEASLERMIEQPKLDAYEATDVFPDGRAMQHPPPGTVQYGERPLGPRIERGLAGTAHVDEVPITVDMELLERGRNRFEIFCATCHGVLGNGASAVAEQMPLIKPPSLIDEPVRSYPAGRIFQVATEGYGVMPSYRAELPTRDRWAIVAYLEALRLAQGASLEELPPDIAAEAKEALQ